MLNDVQYRFFAGLLNINIWGGELVGDENLSASSPAVYVANHAGSLGPIAVVSSLPVRVYPWVVSDMLEWDKAAAYLKKDFVEPQLHLPSAVSMQASRLLSQITLRLLEGIGSIPVWRGEKLLETFRRSVDYLHKGRSLLIFPEDPNLPLNEWYQMSPFQKGFTRPGEMFYEQFQIILQFVPITVHPKLRLVKLSKPIAFNPCNKPSKERARLGNILEMVIQKTYFEMTLEHYSGIPLSH